jgi:hypothetical protein
MVQLTALVAAMGRVEALRQDHEEGQCVLDVAAVTMSAAMSQGSVNMLDSDVQRRVGDAIREVSSSVEAGEVVELWCRPGECAVDIKPRLLRSTSAEHPPNIEISISMQYKVVDMSLLHAPVASFRACHTLLGVPHPVDPELYTGNQSGRWSESGARTLTVHAWQIEGGNSRAASSNCESSIN